MASSFTYKQKFFAMAVGFVILLLASYKKTYKHMFEAKYQLNLISDKLENVDDAYNQIFMIKNEIDNLDYIIGGYSKEAGNVQQKILDFIAVTDYEINISTIADTHKLNDNDFTIYTNVIKIEGSYFELMALNYQIESQFKESRIVSSELFTEKDYKNNKKRLFLKLIFQNYEKNN
jgi:hypothetical protein